MIFLATSLAFISFYPNIDYTLRTADAELVERLKRYLDYTSISYCLPNLNFSTCAVCKSPRVQGISKFIPFTTDHYKMDLFIAINDVHKEVVVTFRGLKIASPQKLALLRLNRVHMDLPLNSTFGISTRDLTVHSGFLEIFEESYEILYPQLLSAIWNNPTYKVILNGHSLGGALSPILAIKLVFVDFVDPRRLSIISFGAPRVGNRQFALLISRISDESYRVTHGSDIIAKQPPRFIGYHHYPSEIWLADEYNGPGDAFKPTLTTPFDNINTTAYICDLFEDKRCLLSTPYRPFEDDYLHLVYWRETTSSSEYGRCLED